MKKFSGLWSPREKTGVMAQSAKANIKRLYLFDISHGALRQGEQSDTCVKTLQKAWQYKNFADSNFKYICIYNLSGTYAGNMETNLLYFWIYVRRN
jgi:hypothetical protein